MKKQVVIIHGGNTFDSYDEYLAYLESKTLSLEDLRRSDWKKWLPDALGEEYEVLFPRMPNGNNAKYAEWKILFKKLLPLLNDGVLLIGHSLGGVFLAKFLSEEESPVSIDGLFLIAAPAESSEKESLADFALITDLKKCSDTIPHTFIYHSKDDHIVPFKDALWYREQLPGATFRELDGLGHLNQETFDELLEDIKSV